MIDREHFLEEVSWDLTKSYFLFFGTFFIVLVALYFSYVLAFRTAKKISNFQKLKASAMNSSTSIHKNPAADNNPLMPKPDQAEKIPDSANFLNTMAARANDGSVKKFNEMVGRICETREGDEKCAVDDGVGGGTATAFDPKKD